MRVEADCGYACVQLCAAYMEARRLPPGGAHSHWCNSHQLVQVRAFTGFTPTKPLGSPPRAAFLATCREQPPIRNVPRLR